MSSKADTDTQGASASATPTPAAPALPQRRHGFEERKLLRRTGPQENET